MQTTRHSRSANARARFFLDLAVSAPPESRVEFEALLEAAIIFARAAVHRMKSKHEKHARWKAWWDESEHDPAVLFFRMERDLILKEKSARLGQVVFAPFVGRAGNQSASYVPATAAELYFFDDSNTPATLTVKRHLDALELWLAGAERLFGDSP